MFVEQPRVDSFPGPNISTKRDLRNLCEVEDYKTGAFKRTTFTYVDNQDVAWFGQTPDIRKYDLTVEDLNRLLQQIPDEKVYPIRPSSISTVSDADQRNLFIKRPKLLCLDDEEETKLLPQMLLEEAEVLEFLKQHHHPNLIRYYGRTVNRGRITGIALENHQVILQYHFKKVSNSFNIVACMEGIRAGVEHLHALGFAHNDLNPMNIALDSNDNPIILDFRSCRRFGEQLLSAGTYGWIEEDFTTSAQRHDEFAMKKIEAWLKEKSN
ncbi:hypothetical protein BU26DRAFT_470815, partial [Trematosphaeria pertusa]